MTTKEEAEKWPADECRSEGERYERFSWQEALDVPISHELKEEIIQAVTGEGDGNER